jgi:hypothetical protein
MKTASTCRLFLAGADHKPDAGNDKGDAQELSHVKRHALLEIHLYLLTELYEEAESEYGS